MALFMAYLRNYIEVFCVGLLSLFLWAVGVDCLAGTVAVYACYSGTIYCGFGFTNSLTSAIFTFGIMYTYLLILGFLFLVFPKKERGRALPFVSRFVVSSAFGYVLFFFVTLFPWSLDEKYVVGISCYALSFVFFHYFKEIKEKVVSMK